MVKCGQPLLSSDSDRMRGDGLRLCHGRFCWGIRKDFFSGVLRHWHRLLSEVVESPLPGGV